MLVQHYSDVIMSAMAPQITKIFIQPFIQAQIKENIKASRHWPLWEEFTSNAENVSIWWRHHEVAMFLAIALKFITCTYRQMLE